MNFTFIKIFGLAFILLANACKTPAPMPTPQPVGTNLVKGVWLPNVGSRALYSKEGIKEAVDVCQKSGLNHIFVCMWNKGRTLYPSKIMGDLFKIPIQEEMAGRDPLRELIDEAHAKNIKVYAWFEYGFAAQNGNLGEHILRIKPQWASLDKEGVVTTKNNFKWMNPFDKEVQDFMIGLLKEVAVNYPDIDGVQGDDRLPALPSNGGYNPAVLAQYKAETGAVPTADTDTKWVDWRAAQLNKVAERIYKEVKAANPKIKVAMAPSIFPFSKTDYLQDWPTWVKNGHVDMVSPQIYRKDFPLFNNEMAKVLYNQVPDEKYRSIIVPGLLLKVADYNASFTLLKQMVEYNRKQKTGGEIFFYYDGLIDNSYFFRNDYQKL